MMHPIVFYVSGKWQKRVIQTLHEAGGSCTLREIRIRCGMPPAPHDPSGSKMRNVLALLVKRGICSRPSWGVYRLTERQGGEGA